jgi:hypothetical protein
VVRRKLYLRRMAAQDAAQLSPRSGFAGPGASQTPAAAAVHASGALGLGLPGQMEAWVDDWLDALVRGHVLPLAHAAAPGTDCASCSRRQCSCSTSRQIVRMLRNPNQALNP